MPTISAFGKLPFHREFLRHQCFVGPEAEYRRWIERGFLAASNKQNRAHSLGDPWWMLYYSDGAPHLFASLLRDSADGARGRAFPFSVFAPVRLPSGPRPFSSLLRELEGTWRTLDSFDARLEGSGSVEAFRKLADGLSIATTSAGHNEAGSPALSDAIVLNGGSEDPEPERLAEGGLQLLWRVRQASTVLGAGRIPGSRLPALRIPLGRMGSRLQQAATWLQLLETRGVLHGREAPITVAISRGDSFPEMWIFIRPMQASDFGLLGREHEDVLIPMPDEQYLDMITGLGDFMDRGREALGRQQRTLAELHELYSVG